MEKEPSSIQRGDDGVYRWNYRLNLYTNYSVLVLVMKVMLLSVFITWLFVVLCCAWSRGFWMAGFLTLCKGFGLIAAILLALTIPSYYLYALIMGGAYSVNFEMDGNGVKHEQEACQQNRAKIISILVMIIGALGRNHGAMNAGRTAGRPAMMYSDFSKVKSIKPEKKQHLMNVSGRGVFNKVYVADDDYEWVLDFIRSHCPKVKP